MDKKAKTAQQLSRKSVETKVTYGPSVTESMNDAENEDGSPTFASLAAKITTAEEATEALTDKKEKADIARAASETATGEQHNANEDFDEAFTELGRGVDDVAKGDKVIIDKAAMDSFFPGKAAPVGDLTRVENLSLARGDEQEEVDGNFDPVKGADIYFVETADDTPDNWQAAVLKESPRGLITASKFTIIGLTSGSTVWVRVLAHGTAGDGPFSDPAEVTVP
jgi:hypothetical protein